MQQLNLLFGAFFFGCLASYMAKRRDRPALLWFFIGTFIGIFSVLILLWLPQVKKQSASPNIAPKKSEAWTKMWYYLDPSHKQQGPYAFGDLILIVKKEEISNNSFIWGEGMPNWKKLTDIPEIREEIQLSS